VTNRLQVPAKPPPCESYAARTTQVACPGVVATLSTTPKPIGWMRQLVRWLTVIATTIASTCALEIVATATGALLAASHMFNGASDVVLLAFLVGSYALWAAGMRANVIANWRLLEQTGINTNVFSKLMFEIVRRRSGGRRAERAASAAGYVGTEIAKEAPYYAGAFGSALVSDTITSTHALVFLAGTNIGAAVYEYSVARLSNVVLERRSSRSSNPGPRHATTIANDGRNRDSERAPALPPSAPGSPPSGPSIIAR
jgi:hypothetical protein